MEKNKNWCETLQSLQSFTIVFMFEQPLRITKLAYFPHTFSERITSDVKWLLHINPCQKKAKTLCQVCTFYLFFKEIFKEILKQPTSYWLHWEFK